MMLKITDLLRKVAAEAEKKEQKAARTLYDPISVRVFFSAPDKPTTQTISEEGNFQWTRYHLTYKRVKYNKNGKPVEVKHYTYETPLYPWGTRAPGGQEVVDADPDITEVDMTPEEAQRAMPTILRKPDLYPTGLKGFYVNTHKSAPNKEYTYEEFNRKFRKSDFYKVVTKSKKLENP